MVLLTSEFVSNEEKNGYRVRVVGSHSVASLLKIRDMWIIAVYAQAVSGRSVTRELMYNTIQYSFIQ